MTFDNIKQAQKSTKSKSNDKQKLIDEFIKNMDEEQKMKFWIKTLLSSKTEKRQRNF